MIEQPIVKASAQEIALGFEDRHFDVISALVKREAGISFSTGKSSLIFNRLARRLRTRGIANFDSYCRLLENDGAERAIVVEALTTNHTSFCREPHHFEYLESEVLPALLDRARRGGRVRFWSAGCSSGEEPYTLALSIAKAAERLEPFNPTWFLDADIAILATDIATQMVETGRAGVYPAERVEPIDADLRKRWLLRDGSGFRFDDRLRAMIAFRPLNLFHPWPMAGHFDVIICRNVMIYFGPEERLTLETRFAGALAAGGHLIIGHSERLAAETRDLFVSRGQTIYQLKGAAA
jgi:chemotaxis protein methyltransferase CheR